MPAAGRNLGCTCNVTLFVGSYSVAAARDLRDGRPQFTKYINKFDSRRKGESVCF